MTERSKKLYRHAIKLDRILKATPGICKTLIVLVLGGIAGEEHCKGREMFGFIVLGFGLVVSLGGLCRIKTKKG